MRAFLLCLLVACGGSKPAPVVATPTEPAGGDQPKVDPEPTQTLPKVQVLAADTPMTTVAGNTFIAPSGWSVSVKGSATILEAPESGSRIALVDVQANDADAAVALAWKQFGAEPKWPVIQSVAIPDKDGWTAGKQYGYQVPPNEKRSMVAAAFRANDVWTVVLVDLNDGVAEKRGAQLGLIFSRLLPKGEKKESFAGKTPHALDAETVAKLTAFVENAAKQLEVPGVGFGLIENGKVVFAGGFGVRALGKPAKVDADTKFMIASNTKALTTLMLAKLVDEGKLTWETTATSLLPSFKLGDADTTSKVLVKHLICACTGLPRQDFEMLFEFKAMTPAKALEVLGTMQPTSKFGELFQYSNPLAAAAGYLGGHVAFPKLELGKAYDEAMRTRVFEPLGMKSATLDFKKGQTGNFAAAHGNDLDGKSAPAVMEINYGVITHRPAGGAWASTNDVLKYVQMELDEGKVGGKQYVSKDALMARRAPQVAMSKDATYGMGLMVDHSDGVTVVHHGGDLIGHHSDMLWLPEHGIGLVILTNGDRGTALRGLVERRLLELLFDGKSEAEPRLAVTVENVKKSLEVFKKLVVVPADPAEVGKLAAKYTNAALGELTVVKKGATTLFDFGEWKSEVGSSKQPDGSMAFVTISPGIRGIDFAVGGTAEKQTLVLRDAQHEYVFEAK